MFGGLLDRAFPLYVVGQNRRERDQPHLIRMEHPLCQIHGWLELKPRSQLYKARIAAKGQIRPVE
jgi:hypothetical protein